ncbi:MAG TPA: hypothetical protein DCR14_08695 [Acidimicrobiaceae bacterium]|nr:hypothetical protein [Acidimicrobiaceae bacterium]
MRTSPFRRPRRQFAALLAAALLVACGGETTTADPTSSTAAASTSAAPTSTEATTTTLATTTSEATTTTVPAPVPVYPLTGLPVTDPAVAARPAVVVKIDNNAKARPQSGLNSADIVFEEIVEVQTRFAAVFHSQGSDPVGPIRSGRTQDVDLLGSLNRPMFVWSGGNPGVTRVIENSDLRELSALKSSAQGAGFYRESSRSAPHNLYATTSGAWSLAPADAGPPPQQFQYLAPGQAPVGEAGAACNGEMDGLRVEWRYDAAAGMYLRTNNGTPHNDLASGQINTNNVVVMFVNYQASQVDNRSPEAQTIGSGEVWVFTQGVLVRGTWSRADRLSPITLSDSSGNPILLTPGRTWVELARNGSFNVG